MEEGFSAKDQPGDYMSTNADHDRDEGSGFNRRQFLALAGGAGSACLIAAVLGPRLWEEFFGSKSARPAVGNKFSIPSTASGTKKVVLITLYGGNDGLNTVIPYQDSIYYSNRAALAIEPSKVLPLGHGYGLNPVMTGFKQLWDEKRLGIVQGVGYSNPSFSHFQSMDIWQSGVPNEPTSTGWLGRWLDATNSSPLKAVSIGPTMPTLLVGNKVQGATIPPGNLILPGNSQDQFLYQTLSQIQPGEPELMKEAAASGSNLLALARSMGPIIASSMTNDPLHLNGTDTKELAASNGAALAIANGGGGVSSPNVLATQLSIVANLILADAAPLVYSVELGGFDTHADQSPTQDRLLAQLDTAVSAFVKAMENTEQGHQVTVVIYTEFGRRVNTNSSNGTDHGWANNVFIVGPSTIGGFYGAPSDLSRLQEGNLVFTTDFRSVYATVFDKILGVDPKSFLGSKFSTLPVV